MELPAKHKGGYPDLAYNILLRALADEGKVYDCTGELTKDPDVKDTLCAEFKETQTYKVALKGKVDSFTVACAIGSWIG